MINRLLVLVLFVPFLIHGKPSQDAMVINVEKVPLYEDPYPIADVIGVLNEGNKVEILKVMDDWVRVKHNGKVGYIHKSSIIKPELHIPSSRDIKTQDAEKMAKIGAIKGFSPDIEDEYRKKNNMEREFKILDEFIDGTFPEKNDPKKLINHLKKFMDEGNLR